MADSTGAEPANTDEQQTTQSDDGSEGITGKVKQAAGAATKIPSAVKDAAAPVTESAASTVKKAALHRRLRSKKVVIPVALTTATAAAVAATRKFSNGGPAGETGGDEGGVKAFLARALDSVTRLGNGGGGETSDDAGSESKEPEGTPGAGTPEQTAQAPKSRRELDEALRAREERRARRRDSQAA